MTWRHRFKDAIQSLPLHLISRQAETQGRGFAEQSQEDPLSGQGVIERCRFFMRHQLKQRSTAYRCQLVARQQLNKALT